MKKVISIVLLLCVILGTFAGCDKEGTESGYWIEEIVEVEEDKSENNESAVSSNSSSGSNTQKPTSSNKNNTVNSDGTISQVKRPSGSKSNMVFNAYGTDKNANYNIKGTVTIAIDTARPTDFSFLFEVLEKEFPNLKINYDYFSHGQYDNAAEYLSSRAATGKLPDIVFDEAGQLCLYASNGWLYPLNNFVNKDPSFKNIPTKIIENYYFNGKLYALPHQAHFNTITINKTLLNKLNLPMPSTNWTFSEKEGGFIWYLKNAISDSSAGIENLHEFNYISAHAFNKKVTREGYNISTGKFELSGSVDKVAEMIRDLRKVDGLEGWTLNSQKDSNGKSKFESKFGVAFGKGWTSGKMLFQNNGTWSAASMKNLKFEWVQFPVPQNPNDLGALNMSVDHCFMTSTCKNPEAAFQVLRFITYSTEGNLARLAMYDKANRGKVSLTSRIYYPIVNSAEVKAKFNSLVADTKDLGSYQRITDIDLYFFNSISKSYRQDVFKFTPDWGTVRDNGFGTTINEVQDGVTSGADAVAEVEPRVNKLMKEAWDAFDEKLADVQKKFKG